MKALTATLLLCVSCASVPTTESQAIRTANQPVSAGISKPGWGPARELAPRRNQDLIEDESGVPQMAHYQGLRKPGYGARR